MSGVRGLDGRRKGERRDTAGAGYCWSMGLGSERERER